MLLMLRGKLTQCILQIRVLYFGSIIVALGFKLLLHSKCVLHIHQFFRGHCIRSFTFLNYKFSIAGNETKHTWKERLAFLLESMYNKGKGEILMKILIAPDSFKGSLSAGEAAAKIAEAAAAVFPEAEIIEAPVADGGEGTLDAIMQGLELETVTLSVTGPDFEPCSAVYGKQGDTAYIEMARTSGLCMSRLREAKKTTSRGFGEAILHALEGGAKTLYMAIGGSATNDGGMGMLEALGVRFLDANGKALEGKGENMSHICTIDTSGLTPLLQEADCYIICDVQNPLLGETGATRVYGPQKGAGEADLDMLEKGMEKYAECAARTLGERFETLPGAGAAGGVGFALLAFAGAKFCPGIDTVLGIIGFDKKVKNADLVITGEGKMDGQSAFGKAPVGVAQRCGGIPVIAMVGGIGDGFEAVYDRGITAVFSVFDNAMPLSTAIENAAPMMRRAAERMLRTVKAGMQISEYMKPY